MWPIVSVVLRYLSFSLAGPAFLPWPSAPVLTPCYRIILILRKYVVTYLRYRCGDVSMDMIRLEWSHPRTIAIRTSDHLYLLPAAGTVVTAVTCTNRTTHTSVSLRMLQTIHARKTDPILAATVRISLSITDIISVDTLMKPNIPAKIVSRMLPAMPITFIKVFDTIDVIMSFLYLV